MSTVLSEDKYIRADRMKYTKNSKSSLFCYLAIILDVFYFVNIYESDIGNWYYQILTGSSIVYNLLFMLFVFLAGEGVKNYKKNYSYILFFTGALQIARIFLLPMQAMNATSVSNGQTVPVMSSWQGTRAIAWLVLSAVCLFLAALINLKKCAMLTKHALDEKAAASQPEEK